MFFLILYDLRPCSVTEVNLQISHFSRLSITQQKAMLSDSFNNSSVITQSNLNEMQFPLILTFCAVQIQKCVRD